MQEKTNNRFILGTIGALLGAIIGAIPWLLMYIFFDAILSILSVFIVIGSFYGYKITKAKIDKKLPIIIAIMSILIITLVMIVIIPTMVDKFNLMYQFDDIEDYHNTIRANYAISLIFGIIIISIIAVNLKKQLKDGIEQKKIKIFSRDVSNDTYTKEDIDKVKKCFQSNDAMDKKHTITKDLILEELKKDFEESKAKNIFNFLKLQQIIKSKSNKYYFSEKSQNSIWYRYVVSELKIIIIVVIIAAAIAGILLLPVSTQTEQLLNTLFDSESLINNTYDLGYEDIVLDMPEDMVTLDKEGISNTLGSEYAEVYDCISFSNNFEKMVSVLNDEKSNYDEDYNVKEYLENALRGQEAEIKEIVIAGYEFTYVDQPYTSTSNGGEYIVSTYVLDAGDRFICIIIDSPNDDALDLNEIIVDNEKNDKNDKNENNNTIINNE